MKIKAEITIVKTKPTKEQPDGGYAAKLKPNFSPDYKNLSGKTIDDIVDGIRDVFEEADRKGLITEK